MAGYSFNIKTGGIKKLLVDGKISFKCPICGESHVCEFDEFYYPEVGKSDSIGTVCDKAYKEFEDGNNGIDFEVEIPIRITSIVVNITAEDAEKC